ncbi:hypothetical protein N7466_006119 [Penicillium verhagenii]|uniref:uncharacterized protein n=1 Tax=Penicillium verhagenii TaxID=1562060 RepID=UPI00254558A5|nr:uncharacterized protein N7466_006119 [Penicillium verhagenii]KAJ5930626.1 hypothetical protein N7466_006119 [Penicillium verhagenii]
MAPIILAGLIHSTRSVNIINPTSTADYFAAQWVNPGDIFSILLLLGPEVIQQAVAQLAGRQITPMAFSFGWVAYAVKALLAAVGDGKLMPPAENANTLVIPAGSGHSRTTTSWVLSRLLRDTSDRLDEDMKGEAPHQMTGSWETWHPSFWRSTMGLESKVEPPSRPWEALRIAVYEVVDDEKVVHGLPTRDMIWISGFVVIVVQLLIAAIPWIVNNEWGTFLITSYGIILALAESSLPQWRREKWACPRKGGPTVTLTEGNGSRFAMVILGKKNVGLDLDILARGTRTAPASRLTRLGTSFLTLNWMILLVLATGLKIDTWYILGVGALGSIHNITCAARPRSAGALGIHIREKGEVIRGLRVADALKTAEELYPGVGVSLVPVFFPGSMRIQEPDFEFWRNARDRVMAPNRWGTRMDSLPPPPKYDNCDSTEAEK